MQIEITKDLKKRHNELSNASKEKMRFPKPCTVCGELSPETLCPTHRAEKNRRIQQTRDNNPNRIARKKELYNPTYRRISKAIREAGGVCHLCGKGALPGDPWQTDHIEPGNPNSPLALAHRSCNASRGNKPHNPTPGTS